MRLPPLPLRSPRLLPAAVAAVLLALTPAAAFAQGVTTGNLEGAVVSANAPVSDALVVAVHLESGTRYVAHSRGDGRFIIPNMRVGGPYTVTAQRIGLEKEQRPGVFVTLGQSTVVNLDLHTSAVQLQGVAVTATAATVATQSGASTTIARENIETMPTISRRIDNLVRLSPMSSGGLSFAGQDSRFNNITVDGSYFNNSFGLGNTPGDRTGVAPISLDAIEQVQVSVAPFDVRQGNFVGANVNSVTRSGTNVWRGAVSYYARNQSMTGTHAGANSFNPGTSKFHNAGGWVSGPILRDRVFFFADYETDALDAPATNFVANLGGQTVATNTTRVLASDLDALSSFLQSKFNYTTGPYQGYNGQTPSTRYLAKVDVNLSDRNKLSVRYNRLDSYTDVLLSNSSSLGFGTRRSNSNGLNFQSSNYQILENIRSTVAELNSTIGARMSNSLIVGYTHQDESRGSRAGSVGDPSTWFPFVDILNGGSVYTSFGFEPFTPNNELRYNTTQLQDNITVSLDRHTLTFGASAEKYHSENVFYPGAQSVYTYSSLADFYTDANDYLAKCTDPTSATCLNRTSAVTLRRFQVRYMNVPGLTKPIQPLDVVYAGVYAQDAWTPNPGLTVTAGVRVDAPWWKNTAYDNPQADALTFRDADGSAVHYNSGALPKTNPLFSPRVGFEWDVNGDHATQLRGGTGIFTGKPAYVWISNQIGNTGILTGFTQVDNTKAYPFNPNADTYKPKGTPTGAPAASYELDVTDRNFKFPQTWRTDVGFDKQLPYGLVATGDFLYNRDINGIYYINANLPAPQAAFTGVDQRPRWTNTRINQNITSAIVLKNENKGYQWTGAASLARAFDAGLFAKLGYGYTVAKNTNDAGSTASSSWTGNQISLDPNNPGVGFSGNSPGHRLFLAASLSRNPLKVGRSTLSIFSEYRTGGNFSYVFSGDANGDGSTSNDLLYIPRDTSEMNFKAYSTTIQNVGTFNYSVDQQKQAWEKFIEQDDYLRSHRGRYAERNAVFTPMVFRTDLSFSQDLSRHIAGWANGLQLRIDILNVGNLINHDWGIGKSTVTSSPLVISGAANDASGKLVYQLRNVGGQLVDHSYDASAGLSDVYRFQLSVRYSFQ